LSYIPDMTRMLAKTSQF